jgi:LCP family protein required for cell wall assembly
MAKITRMSDWQMTDTQPSRATGLAEPTRPISIKKKRRTPAWLVFIFFVLLYFFFPWRTNMLILGIDRSPEGSSLGRSDTMLLVGIQPLTADVKMLSIPRDLWVTLPLYGENRINAAHYFAEAEEAGSGPRAAIAAVENSFGVNLGYFLRVRLEGFAAVVDALGGLEINLSEPRAGLPVGTHILDGTQALAFVRDRQGDDFFRMANGQFFIQALGKALLSPQSWLRFPGVIGAMGEAVDGNLPFWLWPRLGLALLRAGPDGVKAHTLDRTMVTGWTTSAGAQVLLPNWEAINPLVDELFGR